ncbi:YceI family protein [Mariniflexile ostreae]|uniref:YceI family protein n=1 Tax=Mariniflexile ostreae TaxID=1520892 RepID=A0ABV5FB91_9FLAO
MKTLTLFIFSLISFAFAKGDTAAAEALVLVTPSSSLSVKGTTNVNDFECAYNMDELKHPISVFFKKQGDKLVFRRTALVLDNSCFDCGSKGINSDFQKILKTEKQPKIYLYLKELKAKNASPKINLASVDIKIAGITNAYEIPVTIIDKDNMSVNGRVSIRLSDFNMEGPKKLFGLIEVDDTVKIDFQLELKEL